MRIVTSISRGALIVALASAGHMTASAQTASVTVTDPQTGSSEIPDDIIVTGTRATGITAAESAAPIKVLDAELMSHVGQPNLNQVLTQLVPSFTAQAFGGDTANLTLSARLRGLSPNHTLVLINGKRRHGTSNLAVLGGPYQGAATADLDLISPASIKRIEVLEDGAAAQYGSDAIAGVINVILKDDKEGGDASLTAGENYDTGGRTYGEACTSRPRSVKTASSTSPAFTAITTSRRSAGSIDASPISTASCSRARRRRRLRRFSKVSIRGCPTFLT
ncbi:TonB-dependent receptor plug domain-containing protein [Sphingomonas sp. 22L2VL55-3]